MAKITDVDYEEYYAHFLHVKGRRGTVLIFASGPRVPGEGTQVSVQDQRLAEDIAKLLDD